VKVQLKNNTKEAVFRGVFGAPTLFVNEQMFFGQDRLYIVDKMLLNKQ
jgi:2-hydroxychromene-2-carboxylate isomerase